MARKAEIWYYGSPLELETLRAGSTLTRNRELARVFSHRPSLVSLEDDGAIRHDGAQPGILYRIAEPVGEEDVRPHPRSTMAPGEEWLTNRPLRLERLTATQPRPEELLSAEETVRLRQGHPMPAEAGEDNPPQPSRGKRNPRG